MPALSGTIRFHRSKREDFLVKRLMLLGAICALVAAPVMAHVPEGVVWNAFQWPPGAAPTLDGDLSEWDLVPEDYHIGMDDQHLDSEGNADYDFADLNMDIIIGYSADTDMLYFMMERFDDHYDRDGQGGGAGGDDSWEVHIDGDHTGDLMRVGSAVIEDENERALAQGRGAQAYHTRFPPLGDTGGDSWTWFWMSSGTWHTDPQYGDFGFQLDGSLNSGEATAFIEFSKVAWDDFLFTGPGESTLHDFVPEEIIGLGWQVVDHDGNGPDATVDKNWYFSGANDAWRTAASASDFFLAPIDPRVDFSNLPTAVESVSWGRIKAGYID
jgi:hypothetical protein